MKRSGLCLSLLTCFALPSEPATAFAALAQGAGPAVGYFRVYNALPFERNEWAPAGLPFAKGTLLPGGSVAIGNDRLPFKVLERWADGSVRRALIDYPIQLAPFEESRISFTASADAPVGGFLPVIPSGMSIEAIVNGTTVVFDTWQSTFIDGTRWEGLCHKEIGNAMSGLTLDLYSTLWSGQGFGRVTLVVGNDWQIRSNASAFTISDLRLKFNGVFAAPLFGWAHGVQTVMPYQDYRLLSGAAIGDGQRWGTTFTWASPQADLLDAYGASMEPLFGYPEPETEDAARAYGLYGRVKLPMLPPSGGNPYFTRAYWQQQRSTWLATCANAPWTGHGYWMLQEGTTGGYPDWGPAPTLPDDLALTPRGIHRMLQLSLSRVRAPDHYRVGAWNEFPGAGAFAGWISAPYRESSDYFQHVAGSNGWSGEDGAHREEGFRLRAYELTGEHHIYVELKASAMMACLRAKPGFGYGEGRDMARCLQRKVAFWLVADNADRVMIETNLVPWSAWLDQSFPFMNTPTGPLFGLSIIAPGNPKYGTHGFNPMGFAYLYFPWSESHVAGTLAMAASLTEIPALASAADKAGDTLVVMCLSNGQILDAMLSNGQGFLPRSGNLWAYSGLSAFRDFAVNIEAAAAALEAMYQNSNNFDELGWLQP